MSKTTKATPPAQASELAGAFELFVEASQALELQYAALSRKVEDLSADLVQANDRLNVLLNALPAAVVPICGNGIDAWNQRGCLLGNMPMWAFHGDADGTIPVQGSIVPLTGVAACTSPVAADARLTIYPGVGHDSWTATYNLSAGHDIYAWLLTHRRTTAP